MKVIVVCFIALLCRGSETYRILAIFPIPSTSHFQFGESLMKGLVEKGHEVDVISHFPQKEKIPRYNDFSIQGSLPSMNNASSVQYIKEELGSYAKTIDVMLNYLGIDICKRVFNTTVARDLLNSSVKYDLVITEIFSSDCMLGFAHHFKAPAISITSNAIMPWGNDRIGNPDNPSYIPNYFLPFSKDTSFQKRLLNTLITLGAKLKYARMAEANNAVARNFFGTNLPDLRDLAHDHTSLVLVNTHFSIFGARPTVPNFIEVAGMHILATKALPQHLEDYLNLAPSYQGVVYISMGSLIPIETFEKEKLQTLFDVFNEIPYKILWKGTRKSLPKDLEIPDNVRFETWLPQLDILCHPSVKLFVTHGGLLSVQEAIHCGVPLLGMPFFADQGANLLTLQDKGMAIVLLYDDLSKDTVLDATKALLETPIYKEGAEKVSRLFKDRPMSGLNTAIYWVEHAIRHKGAPHLRCAGADLAWYQLYLLDVALFLFAIVSLTFFIFYYLIVIWKSSGRFNKLKKN